MNAFRHDTPAKPDMKLWVRTDKTNQSSAGAVLSVRAFDFVHRSAAPMGLNKCEPMISPGLAPWAMPEYRPKGLLYAFLITLLF